MAAKRIYITATFKGVEYTLTYQEWSDMTFANINTIRKRVSHRNKQIAQKRKQYTNEEIVGAVQLDGNGPLPIPASHGLDLIIEQFHRRKLVP